MKRFLCLLLCAALLAALGIPAAAEGESADARLAAVTAKVKTALKLKTEDYPTFSGSMNEEELGTRWSLRWSGPSRQLNVEALEDGTILSYWVSGNDTYSYSSYLGTFPKLDAAAAKKTAEAFIRPLLRAHESIEFSENRGGRSIGETDLYFSGMISINGLPTPLTWSCTVRGSDGAVSNFWRDSAELSYVGGVPSAKPAVTAASAGSKLRGTITLEPIYVREDGDTNRAVLRYVEKSAAPRFVDAQTGELLENAYPIGIFRANGASASMMKDEGAAEEMQLTAAELEGVDKLKGVLSQDALDQKIRAESAYGLDGFRIQSARYSVGETDDKGTTKVNCNLQYVLDGEDGTRMASFTVDARTGAVENLWVSTPWRENAKVTVSASTARATAEAYLKRLTPNAAKMALYDQNDAPETGNEYYTFTFAQKNAGYFFPENAYTVGIDSRLGTVVQMNSHYDEDITFASASGIVSRQAAEDTWYQSYTVTLGYRGFARERENSDSLGMKGYQSYQELRLSYGLEREGWFSGIDAKTGKIVEGQDPSREISYTDVAGTAAEAEILRLADYGIGYYGGSFRPAKALTQWDAVCLLASTRGYRVDADEATEQEKNGAYQAVYSLGALSPAERKDDAAIKRADLVRMLINACGYGPVAQHVEVFAPSVSDAASIPAAERGYAALAQAFFLIGDRYDGAKTATRAEAAQMLCRVLER